MKKLLKVLGAILGVLILLAAFIVGIHAYNAQKYALPGGDIKDASSYEINDHVRAIKGAYLNGFHFTPAKRSHRGAVVVFGGSEGSPNYQQAKALASEGYEVLALFFFGQPNQQKELVDVPLEFFDEVTAYLNTNVPDAQPLTVIGASKGAELTANLAARGAKIDNIVLYTPSDYTYQGLSFNGAQSSSFSEHGQPVPFLNFRDADGQASGKMFFTMMLGLPVTYRPVYESMPERASNANEARIPIENFNGKGLLFAGDQDAMWPGDVAARELSTRNPNLEAHIYPYAGHLFSEDITALGKSWKKSLGGTVEGNRAAKQQSDQILKAKLAEWHPAS